MAKLGKEPGNYLVNMEGFFFFLAVEAAAFIGAMIYFLIWEYFYRQGEWLVLFFAVIFLVPFFWAATFAYVTFIQNKRNYGSGSRGESAAVEALLEKLSDEYTVFPDVYLDPCWNIDAVVTGPGGIFVIEVKNVGGKITRSSDKLLKDGKKIPGKVDPLQQTLSNVKNLELYLKQYVGTPSVVRPVLLFSNSYANLSTLKPSVRTVHIVGIEELSGFFQNYYNPAQPLKLANVHSVLKGLTKSRFSWYSRLLCHMPKKIRSMAKRCR